ncbi:Histidine kinase-, DNA gyrase B-, and HSP90-like ATPase [Nonlabens sp. Hel1_33_55]|uniref:sensor histidine kinase n=1 Tax=Nonlabens sp. Hel1_33_55 TaxID=1336802 RepID=UPI000875B23C|nr:HAMP domain-containing sensor histidine kinase [Nonlabens sp. Hel1_33_55]SCY37233.1 Histidine kinase-, DNA gyrase B-, and HSP90-like ATPase [Nonlabens sp. Hel1_33_55]
MNFTSNRNILRWIIIAFAVFITSIILWNTYLFFQKLKESERKNMQEYAIMLKDLSNQSLEEDIGELGFTVAGNTNSAPIISENYKGELNARNLPEDVLRDTARLRELIVEYASQNQPIVTKYQGKVLNTTYYGDSEIINKLKYYPLALLLIMFLFGAVILFFYRSTKAAEQNKLWAGMAKESAHQIGTPLSSLVGWTAILRESDIDPSYVDEMDKDINRLQMITERFSKIGSIPTLKKLDVVEQTKTAADYIESRSSNLIKFTIEVPDKNIPVMINEQLFAWVIENLIKNGIDAMRGKGAITVRLKDDSKRIYVTITDTGKGIPKRLWKRIFTPGYTTKKRGWGLGLSLAQRIISDYHNGKLRVKESKTDQGTTFEIVLDKV